ncbi:MAG TPA: STAS domain-containing protein [Nannocystaceae bacterium]|nr:STAS domain-containing protein [Nannocystaceae bacterium]
MNVADVALQGSQKGRLVITVRGRLDESTGRTLRTALHDHLEAGDDLKEIVFDMRELEDYDILGRAELIAAHRLLTTRERRTIYVSTRPRIRGLALMTIREVQDDNACPVGSLEQGERWLDATLARVEQVELRRR